MTAAKHEFQRILRAEIKTYLKRNCGLIYDDGLAARRIADAVVARLAAARLRRVKEKSGGSVGKGISSLPAASLRRICDHVAAGYDLDQSMVETLVKVACRTDIGFHKKVRLLGQKFRQPLACAVLQVMIERTELDISTHGRL